MTNIPNLQLTPQGVLIPYEWVYEWLTQGLELVKNADNLVIRPRLTPLSEREQISEVLKSAGLLAPPPPLPPDFIPLSPEEKTELSRKLSMGRPLSEIIIEDRIL